MNEVSYDAWANMYDRTHSYLGDDIPFYLEEALQCGGPILEVGCGTGRVALSLANAGMNVVGIDISEAMISVAKDKLRAKKELKDKVTFLQRDMSAFKLDQKFALIITPFRSFQALLSVAEQRQALESFRQHLVPGGKLIIDAFVPDLEALVNDPSVLSYLSESRDPITNDLLVTWNRSYVDTYNQILDVHHVIDVLSSDGRVSDSFYRDFQMRYIFRYELQYLIELAGFEFENLYGDFQRTPFDEESSEQVWVVRSPQPTDI